MGIVGGGGGGGDAVVLVQRRVMLAEGAFSDVIQTPLLHPVSCNGQITFIEVLISYFGTFLLKFKCASKKIQKNVDF